jgi:hypothetical protein
MKPKLSEVNTLVLAGYGLIVTMKQAYLNRKTAEQGTAEYRSERY